MTWKPSEHSDQDNLTWSYLRAIEWGRWPIFLSQPIALILLVFVNWVPVMVGIILLNVLWALFVRYRFVSVKAAFWGAVVVRLKWLACPGASIYLYLHGQRLPAILAIAWPVLMFVIGAFPTTQTGTIQKMFMAALGYQPALEQSGSA